MEKALEKYYEDRFSMMATQGWKDLIEDAQAMYDETNKLDNANTENFQFRKGELSILRWLLTLKSVSEQSFEGLKSEDSR